MSFSLFFFLFLCLCGVQCANVVQVGRPKFGDRDRFMLGRWIGSLSDGQLGMGCR